MKKRFFSIKPLLTTQTKFLGLEKYGMVLFDGAFHKEMLSYKYVNGIKRYITGLDEFAPEITSMTNEKLKREKIKYIREEVAALEMQLIYNHIDPNDSDFWNKVKKLLPTNEEFWGKVHIKIDNFGLILDIENNPEHRILYHCIKAGGFSIIAPSYQVGLNNVNKYLFYLDSPDERIAIGIYEKKTKNKAISTLESLESSDNKMKLFYLSKIFLPQRLELTTDMTIQEIYSMLDNFIQANYDNVNKLQEFIDYAEKRENILKIYALLFDMIDMKTLYLKQPENKYYCVYTHTFLGKTLDECVNYLTSPVNIVEYNGIMAKYQSDLVRMGVVSQIELGKMEKNNATEQNVTPEVNIQSKSINNVIDDVMKNNKANDVEEHNEFNDGNEQEHNVEKTIIEEKESNDIFKGILKRKK